MIKDSVWMAENLRTTKFNDGIPIPLIKDRGAWKETKSPGYVNEIVFFIRKHLI